MRRFLALCLGLFALLVLATGCYVPGACGPAACPSPAIRVPTSPATGFGSRHWPYLNRDGSVGLLSEPGMRDQVRRWATGPRPQ